MPTAAASTSSEKDTFWGRDYNSVSGGQFSGAAGGERTYHEEPRGLKGTKKKTHSAWTKLVIWLRTRLIRLGKRSEHS